MPLTVQLTPQLEKHVRMQVKRGAYRSASEYVRDAIRAKQREEAKQRAELDWLRREVRRGFDEVEGAEYTDIKDEQEIKAFFADARALAKRELAAARKRNGKASG